MPAGPGRPTRSSAWYPSSNLPHCRSPTVRVALRLGLSMRTSARLVYAGRSRRSSHDSCHCWPSPAASVAVLACCTPQPPPAVITCLQSPAKASGTVPGLGWDALSVRLSMARSALVGVGCGCHRTFRCELVFAAAARDRCRCSRGGLNRERVLLGVPVAASTPRK